MNFNLFPFKFEYNHLQLTKQSSNWNINLVCLLNPGKMIVYDLNKLFIVAKSEKVSLKQSLLMLSIFFRFLSMTVESIRGETGNCCFCREKTFDSNGLFKRNIYGWQRGVALKRTLHQRVQPSCSNSGFFFNRVVASSTVARAFLCSRNLRLLLLILFLLCEMTKSQRRCFKKEKSS